MLFSRLSGFETCFYNIILAILGCPQFMPIFDDKDAYLCFRLCLSFRTKIGINGKRAGYFAICEKERTFGHIK